MGTAENKALVLRYMKFVKQGQIDQALAADDAVFCIRAEARQTKPGCVRHFRRWRQS
jgi:hypothetical protein